MFVYLSIYLSIFLSICKLENEAILRDFLNLWTWQHQKRSNLRDSSILNLTTSKTKQVCEASSIFEADNIKNETILRDLLQKWKVECRADGLAPMRIAILSFHLSRVLCLPRKSDARSYKCCTCHAKSSQQTWRSGVPRCNLSMCLLYCARHATCIFVGTLQMSHACQCFWNCYKTLTFCSLLGIDSLVPATKRRFNVQKWREHVVFLACSLRMWFASRRRTLFRHWIFEKCSEAEAFFAYFDFEMCFAPQRRALFHLSPDQMAPHPPL